MNTVITIFAHPSLGAVRGTVVDGTPMLCCRELAHLLGGFDADRTEAAMREHYNSVEVVVPVSVTEYGNAVTEKLLFIDQEAVSRMVEITANRAWQMYACWFEDLVFPCLERMVSQEYDYRHAVPFYWTCHDPEPDKPRRPSVPDLFDEME